MNLKEAVRGYVRSMIADSPDSMKVLLLDDDTLRIVSSVFAMSEIMRHGVYLCEKIVSLTSRPHESLPYLDCVCFLRPSLSNVGMLEAELRRPRYRSYSLYFSQSVARQHLKLLAEADVAERVCLVQESFADFQPLQAFQFQLLGLEDKSAVGSKDGAADLRSLGRCTEGITALLLALKICPQVRYQTSSEPARRLAEQLKIHMSREAALFDFKQNKVPQLLIIDRRLDPVTPLLNQWTYQAMINELLSVKNDCVQLPEGDIREVNLSVDHDEFYRDNLYKNFGEICANIKIMMDEMQAKSRCQSQLDTIEDMKRFIETYPSYRKTSAKVSQHVLLISEISRLISSRQLLGVSECEQTIVGSGNQVVDNHSGCVQMIKGLLGNSKITKHDALKLVLLYALRYDRNSRRETSALMQLLLCQVGVTEREIRLVRFLSEYSSIRSPDLFRAGGCDRTATTLPGQLLKSLKGVENIYTQHQPLLAGLIECVAQGKLKEAAFPFAANYANSGQRVTDLIVFVIGGITSEEALAVHSANQRLPGLNVVLGGTHLLNSRQFLHQVLTWAGEADSASATEIAAGDF